MHRHHPRWLLLLVPGALAGCGGAGVGPPSYAAQANHIKHMMDQAHADHAAVERDCPWPDALAYQHTGAVDDPGRKVPSITTLYPDWVQGCAVLTFGLDEDGVPVRPMVVAATSPPAGALALRLLQRSEYARRPVADARYMVRFGMSHNAQGYVILQESR